MKLLNKFNTLAIAVALTFAFACQTNTTTAPAEVAVEEVAAPVEEVMAADTTMAPAAVVEETPAN